MQHLKDLIREVPDFPKPGINFYDITTLLKDPGGFREVIDCLCAHYRSRPIDVVLGIEARGFIIAPAVAYALGYGFIPVRKQKKLPAERERIEYALEYGTDVLEIHRDAITPGQRVLIIDDVLATGGTAAARGATGGDAQRQSSGPGFHPGTGFLEGTREARRATTSTRCCTTDGRAGPGSFARQNQPGSAGAAQTPRRIPRTANDLPDHLAGRHASTSNISAGATRIDIQSEPDIPGNMIEKAAHSVLDATAEDWPRWVRFAKKHSAGRRSWRRIEQCRCSAACTSGLAGETGAASESCLKSRQI